MRDFSVTVRTFEEAAGVSDGQMTPRELWVQVESSARVPGVGPVLPFGVVGVSPGESAGLVLVTVLDDAGVCTLSLDVSGSVSRVLSASC